MKWFDIRLAAVIGLSFLAGCNGCRKEPAKRDYVRSKDPTYRQALKNIETNDLAKLRADIAAAGTNTAEILRLQSNYQAKVRAVIQKAIWKENANR